MVEAETIHYFKTNIGISLSVRFFRGDRDGVVLNPGNPFVEVAESKLKEFKQVNKSAILEGKLLEIPEPQESWETDNALSDEEIQTLLRNGLKLKNAVKKITSLAILYKIKAAAEEKGAGQPTRELIDNRIFELEPSAEGPVDRGEMAGSKDIGSVLSSRE